MSNIHKICMQCGKDFDFTEGEQDFYIQKGLTAPKRCKDCRLKRRLEKGRDSEARTRSYDERT